MSKKIKKAPKPIIPAKFYVGQRPDRMKPGWGKQTLAAAIKHAEEILDDEPFSDNIRIVKVVMIVRRANVPKIREEVK
jgi:hypothetical protein